MIACGSRGEEGRAYEERDRDRDRESWGREDDGRGIESELIYREKR